MAVDIVELYGPGMSFYRSKTSDQKARTTTTVEERPSSLETYSTALVALCTSNQDLETKMSKLRSSTIRLKLDLMKLQRHIDTVQHDLLPTWQADTLTLLIEAMYTRQRMTLPGNFAVGKCDDVEHGTLTKVYTAAARRIDQKSLRKKLGLSTKYHEALRKYHEIVEFRSRDPYQTECMFARWLVSEKEKNRGLYDFWARLFPLCHSRTAEESAEIF